MSDMGLYDSSYSANKTYFLSIYGAPQVVKAVFSALATGRELTVNDDLKIQRGDDHLKFRGFSLGYGKQHGLIWIENLGENVVLWTSRDDRLKALYSAIARRNVPFDRDDLPKIEKILLKSGHLTRLDGWGVEGYLCDWRDDEICDLIFDSIYARGKPVGHHHKEVNQICIQQPVLHAQR